MKILKLFENFSLKRQRQKINFLQKIDWFPKSLEGILSHYQNHLKGWLGAGLPPTTSLAGINDFQLLPLYQQYQKFSECTMRSSSECLTSNNDAREKGYMRY